MTLQELSQKHKSGWIEDAKFRIENKQLLDLIAELTMKVFDLEEKVAELENRGADLPEPNKELNY